MYERNLSFLSLAKDLCIIIIVIIVIPLSSLGGVYCGIKALDSAFLSEENERDYYDSLIQRDDYFKMRQIGHEYGYIESFYYKYKYIDHSSKLADELYNDERFRKKILKLISNNFAVAVDPEMDKRILRDYDRLQVLHDTLERKMDFSNRFKDTMAYIGGMLSLFLLTYVLYRNFGVKDEIKRPYEKVNETTNQILSSIESVIDTKTNLMWAIKDNWEDINWVSAKTFCERFRGGGYSDWRMPTQDELAGLYDNNKTFKSDRIIDVHLTESIRLTASWIWASETSGSQAARFSFSDGGRSWSHQLARHDFRALPVRSNKMTT